MKAKSKAASAGGEAQRKLAAAGDKACQKTSPPNI